MAVHPKQARSTHIQGFFDPTDPADSLVLAVIKRIQDEFGAGKAIPNKEIIRQGVLLLGDTHFPDLMAKHATDEKAVQAAGLALIASRLDKVLEALANGQTVSRDVASNLRQDVQELTAVEASIATRYRPMSFDDDEG